MTINTTANRKEYTGNGVTTAFSFPYYFLADADLVVIETVIATGVQTTKTLTTHYTVTGAGDQAGGTVTMLVAPASTVTLTIYRDPSAIQDVDLVEGDPLPVETAVEQPLDKLTMIAQRVKELIGRALRLPEGDTGFVDADLYLPAEVDRASKYLGFDADGKPVATAGTTDATPHSAFIQTLHDDPDAATARATLGFSDVGFTTGDVKLTLKTVADSGWVLMDDKTIGNAASGATGRANADTEALFTLLWNNTADADCAVSTGRGASAAADYAANKTIALPKSLGRALACYGAGSGLTSRALAKTVGVETHTLTQAETPLKSHTHAITDPGHAHSGVGTLNQDDVAGGASGMYGNSSDTGSATTGITVTAASDATASAHQNVQPTVFLNVMIKL